jgi:hypothetical protein
MGMAIAALAGVNKLTLKEKGFFWSSPLLFVIMND